jgi:porin
MAAACSKFSVIGGMTLTAPLPGRTNDSAGIEIGIAQVSPQASLLDRAKAFYTGDFVPARRTETVIELTYQAQLTPWLQAQPDMQFVINPGGGLVNPDDVSQRLHNEIVVGMRTEVTF